jgi:dTDP-4-dehydrorhamnose reductase
MRILVTGGNGQVGARVAENLPGHDVLTVGHADLDIADRDAVEQIVGAFAPHAIVNPAAITNVDACERDADRAFAVNALGARWLATAAARVGAHVVHVSTDYVFDGESSRPYDEWDPVHPISEYGRSKLAGEREVAAHAPTWAVVRTSWVFGKRGTDIVSWAFGAFDRGELHGVFADQVSVPTYAPDLAEMLARFAVDRRQGLYHVTSGDEPASRHELITTALRARGMDASGVAPIMQVDADRPAARPPYSVLDNCALRLGGLATLRPWRDAVDEYAAGWDQAGSSEATAP